MFPHSLFPITRCLSSLSSLLGLACALLLMLAACEPIELPTDDNGSGSGGSSSGGKVAVGRARSARSVWPRLWRANTTSNAVW